MDNVLYREIPKMDILLARPLLKEAAERIGSANVKAAAAEYTTGLRSAVAGGTLLAMPGIEEIESAIADIAETRGKYGLVRVINATGIILHTNLGRSPLGDEISAHVADVSRGYCTLEYDTEAGTRGKRGAHIEKLICDLTGAEAATVVNNNAGAVFLMLNTLASGKAVAISRGELVEIGGSFRVPEIMAQSGARLMEVGTTNKTHIADYEAAIDGGASVLLKVHTSNFTVKGFTSEVGLAELAETGHARGCTVLYDAGAAFIYPPEYIGIHEGMTVRKCIESGADAVCFSGDKLMGSAQAGVICGKREYIDSIRRNQLARMLRIDKLSLAALEAALAYYAEPKLAIDGIPVLKMASLTCDECGMRAEALVKSIRSCVPCMDASAVAVEDEMGGGSLPEVRLKGYAVRIECEGMSADELERKLRRRAVPVIARINRGGVLLSVRTLCAGDAEEIVAALVSIAGRISK